MRNRIPSHFFLSTPLELATVENNQSAAHTIPLQTLALKPAETSNDACSVLQTGRGQLCVPVGRTVYPRTAQVPVQQRPVPESASAKLNGQLHRFCHVHRMRHNESQRAYQKRRHPKPGVDPSPRGRSSAHAVEPARVELTHTRSELEAYEVFEPLWDEIGRNSDEMPCPLINLVLSDASPSDCPDTIISLLLEEEEVPVVM